jgi:predicted CoA-substrate-specific enzyme activase
VKIKVGLDLGSTAIKAVFTEDARILWRGVVPTVPGQEETSSRLIETGLRELGCGQNDIFGVAVTGYGKKLFKAADKNIDEITANARGVFKLSGGEARTVINIVGQDLKTMTLDEAGRVTDFRMNDKCAAGTGRFFELAARLLDTPISEFSALCESSGEEIELNSTCVVFAESEIVSLLAGGAAREDIIRALHRSVARRAAGLMDSLGTTAALYLDGGPAQNGGLARALADELMMDVRVLESPQFTVAYGAAESLAN